MKLRLKELGRDSKRQAYRTSKPSLAADLRPYLMPKFRDAELVIRFEDEHVL